jgi:lipopolysaccharide/colanic/teichoic acid biosynthesis glycosyltransferase
MDVLVASLMLLGFSWLFAIVAILIKLTSKGPVIFKQLRAGAGGKAFLFYKFRSMRNHSDQEKEQLRERNEAEGPVFKIEDDPRITPLGRFLRKSSIDELPQLWNVLKGDMTLVGPRPPTLDEVPKYDPWQRRRLDLTGGLTCIWQVSGRCEIPFKEWVRMDVRYSQNRTLKNDIKLLSRPSGPCCPAVGRSSESSKAQSGHARRMKRAVLRCCPWSGRPVGAASR